MDKFNGLNTNTVVGQATSSISGGRTVIDHSYPEHKVTDGAFISNPPAQGGLIAEGDLGQFDYNTNTVKHLAIFVATTIAAANATELVLAYGEGYVVPKVGDIAMLAPANFATGTGTAKTIQTVVIDAVAGTATITLDAAIGATAVGTAIVLAAAAGSSQSVAVVPNVAFPKDIYIYQVPAATYNAATGAKYYTSLYDACAILGKKVRIAIPAGARAALRTGYSDIKIVE